MGEFDETFATEVFPAPAGINRARSTHGLPATCVPRASGDKPVPCHFYRQHAVCSPRQRG
ncbi:hypothetical protein EKX22_05385 [Salmonella enterica]|nr:hypothetical protein [Salmonella enterica subsp. enterica serovar Altona]EAN9194891.1 hypothetical protein [Salmonella enterica]EAS8086276.1 hypothetical protein [Salmonella enterica]EBJ1265945.1 hypothetical protein [Salmonella enterica]EBW5262930.1 hypothetical protein [Salmonella enterica subsp. enterica serovar Altona]